MDVPFSLQANRLGIIGEIQILTQQVLVGPEILHF